MKMRLLVLATIAPSTCLLSRITEAWVALYLDQNGGALSGAKVTLINEGTNAQRSAITARQASLSSANWFPALTASPWKRRVSEFEQKGVHRGHAAAGLGGCQNADRPGD